MSIFEYRSYERTAGRPSGRHGDPVPTLEEAKVQAKHNDHIPKSGSWHIERRLLRPWRDVIAETGDIDD